VPDGKSFGLICCTLRMCTWMAIEQSYGNDESTTDKRTLISNNSRGSRIREPQSRFFSCYAELRHGWLFVLPHPCSFAPHMQNPIGLDYELRSGESKSHRDRMPDGGTILKEQIIRAGRGPANTSCQVAEALSLSSNSRSSASIVSKSQFSQILEKRSWRIVH
jgi:hypothetical protein